MPSHWYFVRDGETHGPVSSAELKRRAAAGEIKPNDVVWKEGSSKRVRARHVRGLLRKADGPIPSEDVESAPRKTSESESLVRPSTAEGPTASRRNTRAILVRAISACAVVLLIAIGGAILWQPTADAIPDAGDPSQDLGGQRLADEAETDGPLSGDDILLSASSILSDTDGEPAETLRSTIAVLLIESKNIEAAHQAIGPFRGPRLANALADNGFAAEAIEVADQIAPPPLRAQALANIAATYPTDSDEAKALFKKAEAVGHIQANWTYVYPLMAESGHLVKADAEGAPSREELLMVWTGMILAKWGDLVGAKGAMEMVESEGAKLDIAASIVEGLAEREELSEEQQSIVDRTINVLISSPTQQRRARELCEAVSIARAKAGRTGEAGQYATMATRTDPSVGRSGRIEHVCRLAHRLLDEGLNDVATILLRDIDSQVEVGTDPEAVAMLALALARSGDMERSRHLSETLRTQLTRSPPEPSKSSILVYIGLGQVMALVDEDNGVLKWGDEQQVNVYRAAFRAGVGRVRNGRATWFILPVRDTW